MLQVCLNGARDRRECRDLPMTARELAAEARRAVAAGAEDIHLHPKDTEGRDSLEPELVGAAVTEVRAAVPEHIQVGVTTGAWTVLDPRHRTELIRSWSVLPDHASVNWHEDGADAVAIALLDRGIAIEAGIYSGTDAIHRFLKSPYSRTVLRVLAEVTDTDPEQAAFTAMDLVKELEGKLAAPVLLHGENAGAWPVLRVAARLGLDTRIGFEDVLTLPNGSVASDNAALVHAARELLEAQIDPQC
ncbi:3-keto-5-aminohexanoate cleavage protein [Nocardia sp. CA-151230]|uniref:3-keto-5-aminohexanoate cleavage protein n=1 Tax=Nocardia sp. CA-151230 TaxID=3239982 RepID=UPI003D8A1377